MKIWLDLELKQDIDDYITLLFAIETNKNITEISINNPSINELKLLNNETYIDKINFSDFVDKYVFNNIYSSNRIGLHNNIHSTNEVELHDKEINLENEIEMNI